METYFHNNYYVTKNNHFLTLLKRLATSMDDNLAVATEPKSSNTTDLN